MTQSESLISSDGFISEQLQDLLKACLTFVKQTFAVQDENNISDKFIELLLMIFSNVFNFPIIFTLIFIYGRVSSFYQAKRTKYYFQPSNSLFSEMLQKSKLTQMRYKPWTYAFNGHWQAVLYPAVETVHKLLSNFKLTGEVLALSDGGQILLDWYVNPNVTTESPDEESQDETQQDVGAHYTRKNPLVVIVPGLTGDSTNLYVQSTLREAEKHGYDAVVVNYRCQAGVKPTSPHIYHGANTTDLQEAIEWIMDVRTESELYGVGISLGAGILANYVAKMKDDCPLKAAVSVGCYYDTERSMNHLKTYWFGVYDYILGLFTKMTNQETVQIIDGLNAKHNPDRIIGADYSKVYRLTGFIENIVMKIQGIKNYKDYLLESSCTHRLKDVKIPLFFLSANDDPIFGNKCIPYDQCHENILIGVTKAGGHLGYFEGLVLPHKQWFPEPSFEFLNFVRDQGRLDPQGSLSYSYSLTQTEIKRKSSQNGLVQFGKIASNGSLDKDLKKRCISTPNLLVD